MRQSVFLIGQWKRRAGISVRAQQNHQRAYSGRKSIAKNRQLPSTMKHATLPRQHKNVKKKESLKNKQLNVFDTGYCYKFPNGPFLLKKSLKIPYHRWIVGKEATTLY